MRHPGAGLLASTSLFMTFVSESKKFAVTPSLEDDITLKLLTAWEKINMSSEQIVDSWQVPLISTLSFGLQTPVFPDKCPGWKNYEVRNCTWELDMTCGQLGNIWLHGSKAVVDREGRTGHVTHVIHIALEKNYLTKFTFKCPCSVGSQLKTTTPFPVWMSHVHVPK